MDLLADQSAPLPGSDTGSFRRLAHVSWILFVVGLGIGLIFQVSPLTIEQPPGRLISVAGFLFLFQGGAAAGLVALFGMERRGFKGVLWPAVIGLGLWAIAFLMAVSAFFLTETLAEARRIQRERAVHEAAIQLPEDRPAAR